VVPFFLPVEGRGPIKRLIMLDVPGSDDILANTSLFADEGFQVADLIVAVGKQERSVTSGTADLLHSIVDSSGGLEPAIGGHSKVCSWGELAEVPLPEPTGSVRMLVTERCLRPSVRKVAYLMTHADEQLAKVAKEAQGRGITGDMTSRASLKARELANDAWNAMRLALAEKGLVREHGLDEIAVASCCTAPFAFDHRDVVKTAIAEKAILDAAGVRKFLAGLVPPEVAALIRGRTPFRDPSARAAAW
jgi:hypothetical protein